MGCRLVHDIAHPNTTYQLSVKIHCQLVLLRHPLFSKLKGYVLLGYEIVNLREKEQVIQYKSP